MIGRPRSSPLFPYPPLFRSRKTTCPAARVPPTWPATPPLSCTAWPSTPPAARRAQSSAASRSWRCGRGPRRSEEHTSELQSPCNLVCRLLLEKKKKTMNVVAEPTQDHVPAVLRVPLMVICVSLIVLVGGRYEPAPLLLFYLLSDSVLI